MSSTKRSGERLLHASDYYITPHWAIRDFLDAFRADADELGLPFTEPLIVLDPCAGGDNNHAASYPKVILEKIQVHRLVTVDIREDSAAEFKGCDFMHWKPTKGLPGHYDWVITNPPFALAEQIISRSMEFCDPDHGLVIMLLRLNFYGGQKRKDFFQRCPPVASYVHSKRLGFTDNGSTDSIEYQHAIWAPWMENRFTALRVI
jgi:hypothetical protein